MSGPTPTDGSAAPPTERVRYLVQVLYFDDLTSDRTQLVMLRDEPLTFRRGDRRTLTEFVGNELRLADPWASGSHAHLQIQGESRVLEDLGSSNGTFINGKRIDRQVLTDRDMIEVGHTLFVYRVVEPNLAQALQPPWPQPGREGVFLGPERTKSAELASCVRQLLALGPTQDPVLIEAESGSGRERAAATLHKASKRGGPFVAVDLYDLSEDLIEPILFGEGEVLTQSAMGRAGEIARADRGTFFLKGLERLSPKSQAQLLRVMEAREVTPLGRPPIPIDVRWVAATNVVPDPSSKDDLLARFRGHVVQLPPLRLRREDLGFHARVLFEEQGAGSAAITVQAARALFLSSFPGNVRELRATLRNARVLAQGNPIDLGHLGDRL